MRDMSLWVVNAYLLSRWGERFLLRWGVRSEELATQGLTALPAAVQWGVAVFSVLLTIFFLYVIGVLTANIVGRRVVQAVERLLDRVPFVKTVYRACKQILETFAGESGQSFQRVALIPFPSREMRSVAFVTGITQDTHTGEEICTVFVATTPNPTTGFVFIVKRSDIVELDWTIEDAIRVIISGGVLVPSTVPLSSLPRPPTAAGARTPPASSPATPVATRS